MLTFQECYEKAQTIAGDTSAETLALLKSDINMGSHKFNAALDRYFTRKAKTTNIVANQQYYQLPVDCIKVSKVRAKQSTSGSVTYPLRQIHNETEWDALNTTSQTGNWAIYFFQRGHDEIGIYPTPSDNITDGLEIAYEPRDKSLTQDDYTTGTVTVAEGSAAVTGSGTTFTQSMIGRVFKTTEDGYAYKVAGYSSATSITLEEPYIGQGGSSRTYKIGESFLFPEEFHDAPVDFALSRFFEMRNNPERAVYHLKRYRDAVDTAKSQYSSSSSSAVITSGVEEYNIWLVPPNAVTGG